MYTVDELDVVVPLSEIPKLETGAPRSVVAATEYALVLSYWLPDGPPYGPEPTAPFAFVRFSTPYAHLFGPPNDEALHGHPLWGRGLQHYGVFSVQNSSLVRRLERMNSVHEYHDTEWFKLLHHYVFTFHDSTFECVAKSIEASVEHIHSDDQVNRMMEYLKAKS